MRAYAIAATALFLGGSILTFTGVSAWAESTTARPPAGQPEQRDRSQGPAAPVGHRQPQTKELAPAEMPPADHATRDLDKALEKKLTICRGC
ncbi:MAG TPA: hypothetical protein VF913_07430 [Xanthobacteraceae bacterium]